MSSVTSNSFSLVYTFAKFTKYTFTKACILVDMALFKYEKLEKYLMIQTKQITKIPFKMLVIALRVKRKYYELSISISSRSLTFVTVYIFFNNLSTMCHGLNCSLIWVNFGFVLFSFLSLLCQSAMASTSSRKLSKMSVRHLTTPSFSVACEVLTVYKNNIKT